MNLRKPWKLYGDLI